MIRDLKKGKMEFLRQLKHEVRRRKRKEATIVINVPVTESKFNRRII
jgi:hypothetical protein